MDADYRNSNAFSEEDKQLARRLLRMRAIGTFVIVGLIALIAVTSGVPFDENPAASAPTAPNAGATDAGLSALERGSVG